MASQVLDAIALGTPHPATSSCGEGYPDSPISNWDFAWRSLWVIESLVGRLQKVEPNSPLGEAIAYMKKHWRRLVLFLRKPGAPLDNTVVERTLKRAILHRKNSLFYKTLNGALVGDRFMSLIHSAELNGADPSDYLNALLKNAACLEEHPERWMPWCYRDTLEQLAQRRVNDAGPAG